MADLDKATNTQLSNIETRTGKSIDELARIIESSGLSRHGELVGMLKSTLGMGHGDANLVVHVVRKAADPSAAREASQSIHQVLDGLYTGRKEALRPIHDRLQTELDKFGVHEWVPKKGYVSYRQKKQFAMVGPATNTHVEIGLNVKNLTPTERLQSVPAGQMCNYKLRLSTADDVNAELLGWLRQAYDSSK